MSLEVTTLQAVLEIQGDNAGIEVPVQLATVEFMGSGPQGVQGVAGAVALVSKEAAAVIAAGQVVRANGAGKLVLAQADTLGHATGAVVAQVGAAIGFAAQLASGFITLADWTAVTGSVGLVAQTPYYLSASTPGALTVAPPETGVVLPIGVAIDSTTLILTETSPITL
jgi:hypothetical protein